MKDPHQEKAFAYEYDGAGNILSKTSCGYLAGALQGEPTVIGSYAYGDPLWKDKMTAYNGLPIDYDEIGNPLDDGTWQYTWQAGRQLAGLSSLDGETDIAFKYDADGLRVRKEVNGQALQYTLAGNRIVRILGQGKDVVFRYDPSGRPALLRHNTVSHNGNSEFLYVYNLQGDVVALLSSSTLTPVVEYFYDAWGKPTGCTGPLANTLGKDNPFRYRGYVYDEETGWYSLPARYYNPEWGRFINADALMTRNLFAYCANNPVMFSDPSGMSLISALMAAVAAVVTMVKKVIVAIKTAAQNTGVTTEQAGAISAIVQDESAYSYPRHYKEGEEHTYKVDGVEMTCEGGCKHYKFGIYPGNNTIHVCCAYLLAGVFGGYKSVKLRKSACTDVFALSSVDQITPGMELFQGDKHVGKALMWDFGNGAELSVFHSSTGNNGQGPVVEPLIGLGNWTHAGTPTNQGGDPAFFLNSDSKWYVFK